MVGYLIHSPVVISQYITLISGVVTGILLGTLIIHIMADTGVDIMQADITTGIISLFIPVVQDR